MKGVVYTPGWFVYTSFLTVNCLLAAKELSVDDMQEYIIIITTQPILSREDNAPGVILQKGIPNMQVTGLER